MIFLGRLLGRSSSALAPSAKNTEGESAQSPPIDKPEFAVYKHTAIIYRRPRNRARLYIYIDLEIMACELRTYRLRRCIQRPGLFLDLLPNSVFKDSETSVRSTRKCRVFLFGCSFSLPSPARLYIAQYYVLLMYTHLFISDM